MSQSGMVSDLSHPYKDFFWNILIFPKPPNKNKRKGVKSDQGSPEKLETVSPRAAEPEPRERLILDFQGGEAAMIKRFYNDNFQLSLTIFHGGEAEINFIVLIGWEFFMCSPAWR